MDRRGWTAIVSVLTVLLVAACSGGSPDRTGASGGDSRGGPRVDESKPPLRPDWPLAGVWLASGLGPDGGIVDPRLVFTTDDVEVTAVVALGADVPDGATLLVHWFRVGLDERRLLFTHEIPVGPGGLALSRGTAPPGLAPGFYEVVAILGKHQTRTPWVVRVAEARLTGISTEASHLAQATSEPDEWEVPAPDDFDWTGERGTPLDSPPPPGPCALDDIHGNFTPATSVEGRVSWTGTCNTLTISAAVSGPPVTVYTADVSQDENGMDGSPPVDVCDLPGGSDMPGTVVHFEAAMSDGPVATGDLVLKDKGRGVLGDVNSRPSPSSHVDAGQTIELRAIGLQVAPARGIRALKLLAGGQEIGTTGNASGSTEPIPCDEGRFYAFLDGQYTVPDPPPPVIEICAVATTFEGHEGRGCIEFYTGEVWTGTYRGTVTFDCEARGQQTGTLEAEFTITVADGVATMDIMHTVTGSCAGPDVGTRTTPITATGERTPTGFEFASFGALFGGSGSLIVTVSGHRGTGAILITDLAPGIAMVELAVEIRRGPG